MRIVPISKHEYKVFPIADEEQPYIEITKEEYEGLESFEKCFSDDLTRVVDYVKSEEEIQEECVRQRNFELIEQIGELKVKLGQSDYKALKYIEGELTAEEYAPIKAERHLWRSQINELESQLTEV